MTRRDALALGLPVLLVVCSGIYFWRTSQPAPDPLPPTVTPPPSSEPEIPSVEPSLSVGSRVEALSSEGWQMATIKEIADDQALIAYQRSALGEERVDVRLLRKPEAELTAKPVPPSPSARAPAIVAGPATPPAPPLGPRITVSRIPTGDYICESEQKGTVKDPLTDDDGVPIKVTLMIEILSDRVYRAFNGDDDGYSYDPASGRIIWENGMLGQEEPGQYRADSKSIVTSVGGHVMTCTLRR